jgi:hypothetical protein
VNVAMLLEREFASAAGCPAISLLVSPESVK